MKHNGCFYIRLMFKNFAKMDYHNDRTKGVGCAWRRSHVPASDRLSRGLGGKCYDRTHGGSVTILFSLVLRALLFPEEIQKQFHEFCIYNTIVAGQPTGRCTLALWIARVRAQKLGAVDAYVSWEQTIKARELNLLAQGQLRYR